MMGRYSNYNRVPCPYDYPRDCNCPTCVSDRGGRVAEATVKGASGRFDGKSARIDRSGGTINVYYGGRSGNVPGDGHGHVKATGGLHGESIVFWRLPESEGGQVIVSNSFDVMYGNDLREHLNGS